MIEQQLKSSEGLYLGTWLFGGKGWQAHLTQKEVTHLVTYAVNSGIRGIDTAPAYGLGRAEELLAEPLKSIRNQIVLVTKCGLTWDSRGRFKKDNRKSTLLLDVSNSLKRLKVDCVDVLLVHWPDGETPIEEVCDGLNLLLQKGYCKTIGLSNWPLEEIQIAKKLAPIQVVQDQCNLAKPLQKSYMDFCKGENLWSMGYSPLAQGLLTDKYEALPKLPKKDFRNFNPLFFEPEFSRVENLIRTLKQASPESNTSITQLALRYTQTCCNCAVVGVRNEKQLKEALKSHKKKLKTDMFEKIQNIV